MLTKRRTVVRLLVTGPLALTVFLGSPGHRATGTIASSRATASRLSVHPRPMKNGVIAFIGGYANASLNAIDPNSGRLRSLAGCTTVRCEIAGDHWSPDGRRMAFLRASWSSNTAEANFSLFVVNANGSGARRLASCSQPNGCVPESLAWSPNGSRIAFSRFYLGIYVVNLGTGNVHRITHCGAKYCGDVSPSWSPDGSTILFSRAPGCRARCPSSPYVMNADGSGVKRLSIYRGAGTPLWSPDGRRIVFDAFKGIFTVNPDGSHLRLLAHAPPDANEVWELASWSPDGRHILSIRFPGVCSVGPHPGGEPVGEVWITNANGAGQRRLYQSRGSCPRISGTTWSPDGQLIAFSVLDPDGKAIAARSGLFVMGADGRRLHRLLASGYELAWQPIP